MVLYYIRISWYKLIVSISSEPSPNMGKAIPRELEEKKTRLRGLACFQMIINFFHANFTATMDEFWKSASFPQQQKVLSFHKPKLKCFSSCFY